MTNSQNIRNTISQLRREKRELEPALREAEKQNKRAYDEVMDWEEAYLASGENEEIGQKLDKAYDEYNKVNEAMCKTKKRVEAIKEALEALCNAAGAIEWLGL